MSDDLSSSSRMNILHEHHVRWLWLPGILYLTLSLVCTQLPLLNYLGYEFSFVFALVGSLVSGPATISYLRSVYLKNRNREMLSALREGFREVVSLNLLFLIIPLLALLTNALFVKNCSLLEGLAFFLLLPVVSVWFSSCLAFFCTVHYRHPLTLFLLLFVATLAYAAGEGYFTPAIYSYNFFYGFFPGFTYDELLEISWSLIGFRLFTAGIGAIILLVGTAILEDEDWERRTVGKGLHLLRTILMSRMRIFAFFMVFVLVGVYIEKGDLGWESTGSYIQDQLGSMVETEHFTIYYADSACSDEEIAWIAAEHEYRLEQVLDSLHITHQEKIESYLYPSVEAKRRYIGTGSTSIAKPWSGQIHLSVGDLREVLKHELVHVVAAPFGVPVIRASLSPGLTEGLAMAVEGRWGNRELYEYAAAMKRFGIWPDMEAVMGSTGFFAQASSVSYVLAGSFTRFLADEFGIRSVMNLYRSGDYEATYGSTLHNLLGRWESSLDSVSLDFGMRDIVSIYFRRPPIFGKTCPHAVARKIVDARERFGRREYEESSRLYLESYREGNSMNALGGFLLSELRLRNTSFLYQALDTVMLRDEFPERFLPLFLTVGDAYWIDGKTRSARELYARVECADFSEGYTEAAIIRSLAAADTTVGTGLRSYILSDQSDSLRLAILDSVLATKPGDPLALFLRGRFMLRNRKPEEALRDFRAVSFSEVNRRLEAGRLRAAGLSLFRLRRFQEARSSFRESLNYHETPFVYGEILDLIDRCEWYEEHDMPTKLERKNP